MEQTVISGIAFSRDEAKITVVGVPDRPGIASRILGAIASANIEVDMIIQNQSINGKTDFTFTVPRPDYNRAMDLLNNQIKAEIGATDIIGDAKAVSYTHLTLPTNSRV